MTDRDPPVPPPDKQFIGITLQQIDLLKGNAQPRADDLAEGRAVALTIIERPGNHGHPAIFAEPNTAIFLARGAVTSR